MAAYYRVDMPAKLSGSVGKFVLSGQSNITSAAEISGVFYNAPRLSIEHGAWDHAFRPLQT